MKNARVTLEWADGEYLFALNMKELEELEAVCANPVTGKRGIGLGAIWQRVMGGTWYSSDLYTIIRLGLIGGGMGEVEAKRMVKTYAMGKPISSAEIGPNSPLSVAQAILASAVVGVDAEEEEEIDPGEQETPQP